MKDARRAGTLRRRVWSVLYLLTELQGALLHASEQSLLVSLEHSLGRRYSRCSRWTTRSGDERSGGDDGRASWQCY